MARDTRFRREGDATIVDVRVREARQLFDLRDPAPFHERDLDEKAVEYLTNAFLEIPKHERVIIRFHVEQALQAELSKDAIVQAVRAHFEYEEAKADRVFREHMSRAWKSVLVGTTGLAVLLSLAYLVSTAVDGAAGRVLEEGLTISGWVAMWRPLELAVYEWWPFSARRTLMRRIRAAAVEVT